MSEFIRVLTTDPHFKTEGLYVFIDPRSIRKVYPVWAEEHDGKLFLCTQNHSGGRIVSYTLVDGEGQEYSCGDSEELKKLGIRPGGQTGNVGFVCGETGDEARPVDLLL
jgi:hypothetical protein